ncbi:MAG: hypothetical protein JXE07_04725 [Candidatus Aminicenantes bacterium]|nr:hypothetical protein [Candidatus Aminicenantes bacterium]
MKRLNALLPFLVVFMVSVPPLDAQFTADEVAQRPFWEEFLQTAQILRSEEIGEGVTKPFKFYLQRNNTKAEACWKNPKGLRDGFLEGWQYEIAAYRLDKLLGINMVPPAVEREFNGKPGALVYWVTSEHSLLEIVEEGIEIPESARLQTENTKYLTRAWDSLVANDDRTQQNVLYTKDWRMILIDHSQAFRSGKEYTDKLLFGANGLKRGSDGRAILFRRLPRWFVDNVKKLDFQSVKEAVGPYLTDKEIEAVIKRKALLLAEIEGMIKANGEAKVLY